MEPGNTPGLAFPDEIRAGSTLRLFAPRLENLECGGPFDIPSLSIMARFSPTTDQPSFDDSSLL